MKVFTLRIPEEMFATLRVIAEEEHRSVNSQILHIIAEYIKQIMEEKDNPQG